MTHRIAHITKAGARNTLVDTAAVERDAWETPWPIVHALGRYAFGDDGGFDLDVAASDHNAKAPRWYTDARDGLRAPWHDVEPLRIWCNPPWSSIRRWLDRAHDERDYARSVVLGPLSDTTIRWSVERPMIAWRIVGDGRLAYVRDGRPVVGATQASVAWFFSPLVHLAPGGGVISSAELGELARGVGTKGLPLFGG